MASTETATDDGLLLRTGTNPISAALGAPDDHQDICNLLHVQTLILFSSRLDLQYSIHPSPTLFPNVTHPVFINAPLPSGHSSSIWSDTSLLIVMIEASSLNFAHAQVTRLSSVFEL